MPNFSSLAGLEVAEKFLWGVGGVVCTVIFVSNQPVVLRLGWGWGFDKNQETSLARSATLEDTS